MFNDRVYHNPTSQSVKMACGLIGF